MPISEAKTPPILRHKSYETSSAFTPENLLRQARRQKRLPNIAVPEICILDPDGDIVRNLRASGRASRHDGWPCYHTELYVFCHDGHDYGIVGCAVGAAFAVLIAEELFASGCRLLLQYHVRWPDRSGASSALFRRDRPRVARRRHELSLFAGSRIQ